MIHTTADFEMLDLVCFHPQSVANGVAALSRGGLVVTDTEMARKGIPVRRMDPLGCEVRCLMNDPRVAEAAKRNGTTRAFAAVDFALDELHPSVWVVGNAPTALIRLVDRVREGAPVPDLVVGMPVGFVNAAESKDYLMDSSIPHIAVKGRKGGSALAACVVNALAEMALRKSR
ncbi:precorrin-8X methylmutase [Salidesulfovibrio brasiliensis]|uniref:precorrin-8X methylmutase n=1 Tax=Salidesulfovibrio brasiliensis TaxID=221711 RepID=UPI000B2E65F2